MEDALAAVIIILGSFSGVALIIRTAAHAKLERLKIERQIAPQIAAPGRRDDAVLAELQALRQQVQEMQSTSHQFDISFDEALGRLEGRVNRLETKTAVSNAAATTEDLQRITQ